MESITPDVLRAATPLQLLSGLTSAINSYSTQSDAALEAGLRELLSRLHAFRTQPSANGGFGAELLLQARQTIAFLVAVAEQYHQLNGRCRCYALVCLRGIVAILYVVPAMRAAMDQLNLGSRYVEVSR